MLQLCFCLQTEAQSDSLKPIGTLNNWQELSFPTKLDTLVLSDRPVFPNSLQVQCPSYRLNDSCYTVVNNLLLFQNKPTLCDTVRVRFRLFPYPIQQTVRNRKLVEIGKKIDQTMVIGTPYTYNPFNLGGDAFNFSDLDYSGVFSRGISLGNAQDLILNSNFNLQVAGQLGDVEILAAISDNNVPLQPEGNTQQLQDFDRIYVQFSYKKQQLIAGDYNIKRPKGSHFLNYFRRLQGGQLRTDFKLGKKGRLTSDVSFAISRGQFARNNFLGQEGNQGPYRLTGNAGEQFIIIIAGTERVFIDGTLMTRGADNDYIIDYNLGEITFSPNQLITKDKRIQVEFSYSDLTYLRSLATANVAYESQKSTVRFNFYSEQDAKGQQVSNSLSDSAKAVLQRSGDNTDQAFISSINIPDPDAQNSGSVFYLLRDTLVNGNFYDSVLLYSNHPDSAIYTAKFALVDKGGNYIRLQGAANGVVYQWIAPDPISGQAMGTHAAVQLLTPPKQRQLYNVGFDYRFNKHAQISADIALSNVDENTFSTVGNQDNQGLASRLTYRHTIPIWGRNKPKTITRDSQQNQANTQLKIDAHYEFLMQSFEFIEPYRTREFARDWNISQQEATQEHLYKLSLDLIGQKWGSAAYEFSGLNKSSLYNGYRHQLNATTQVKGFRFWTNSSLTQSRTSQESSLFARPRVDLSYTVNQFKNLKIRVYGELEQNQRRDLAADSLMIGSLYYNVLKVYADLPASKNLNLHVHYSRRHDYTADSNRFLINAIADDFNVAGKWDASKYSKLKWNLTYRNLAITDTMQSNERPKETYLGRLEYLLNIKNGFLRSSTIYQLGSGQQQQIQYEYVSVDIGQGSHIWVDRNEDQIEQVNEFELSNFQDQANYIRVSLLTGQFIRTNNVLFSQSLTIRPKVWIRSAKKKKQWNKTPIGFDILERLSTRSIFKIERKTYDGADGVVPFNPFQLDVADSALVSVSSSIQNNLYFNRTGLYSLEFTQRDNRGRTLLSTGFETRGYSEYALRQRINIKPSFGNKDRPKKNTFGRQFRFQAQLIGALGQQSSAAEFFPERALQVDFYRLEPQFSVMYKNLLRVVLRYKYQYKENRINLMETLNSHDITTEFTYSQSSKTNIRASFSVVQVDFSGDATTATGYTITEGLQSGSNFLWKMSLSQALSRNIQMTLSYEGRKTGDSSPIVHVGRAEIRANF